MSHPVTQRRRGSANQQALSGWLFISPVVIIPGLFLFVPIVMALWVSVSNWQGNGSPFDPSVKYVGARNYQAILGGKGLTGRDFGLSIRNNLFYVLLVVPLQTIISLFLAVMVTRKGLKGKGFFRTAFYAPVVTTVVAVAVIWRYLFHTQYGLVNWLLGHAGIGPIDWLGDPHWAMPTIILFAVWKNFGYNMIIFLAGLQSIPEDLYEAARIDGASRWAQFRHVTLPQLGPVLLLVGILTMAGYFQLFAEPYVMTQGGPLESTKSVLYLMYEEGFKWWNLGNASAVAFLLFILMTAVTSGLLWFARRRGVE